jgi:hypothetical protein
MKYAHSIKVSSICSFLYDCTEENARVVAMLCRTQNVGCAFPTVFASLNYRSNILTLPLTGGQQSDPWCRRHRDCPRGRRLFPWDIRIRRSRDDIANYRGK